MNYVTTIEMSEKWGISARRIALLCEEGQNLVDSRKCRKACGQKKK